MEGVATRFTLPVGCQAAALPVPAPAPLVASIAASWICRLVSFVRHGHPAAQSSAHPPQVRALAYSPSGASLAAGGDDEGIKLVDMSSARVFRQLKSQVGAAGVLKVSFEGVSRCVWM